MPSSRIYRSTDCDLNIIHDKRIVVVGYGSQGRAFALNLRDSDCQVRVALREGSSSSQRVASDWLPAVPLDQVAASEIVILAFPDHEQPNFYGRYLAESTSTKTVVFLHGSNVHFGNIEFQPQHDVILVAPHGPGSDLRANYLSGVGLSCFFAVHQDYSGHAREVGLALAAGIGADKAGVYETSFKEETIGDLFGEQTLLVGGLAGLTTTVFETLVDKGVSPENAYLETVKQLKLLASMLEQFGPAGMIERVSKMAAYGSLRAIPLLFDEQFQEKLGTIYREIESGEFNRLLQKEAQANFPTYDGLLNQLRKSACQKTCDERIH